MSNASSGLCINLCYIKQILHATVLDIKAYYYPRNAAELNIAIPRIVINLISNTVKVQYLFYYIHHTCIQNRVRSMKAETKHSSKTTLRYQQRNATATAYMRSRMTTLLASEGLASHFDIRLAVCL